MTSPIRKSTLADSEGFTSPRSDPFAIGPDPLSDSEGEDEERVPSTIKRSRRTPRPSILSNLEDSLPPDDILRSSTYRDADSYAEGQASSVKEQSRGYEAGNADVDDDDEDEPPASIMYESGPHPNQSHADMEKHEHSRPHHRGERQVANRGSLDMVRRDSEREDAGSPFIQHNEDESETGQVRSDRDLGSSSTPQPYERSRTRFSLGPKPSVVNSSSRLSGSGGSNSPPMTPHAPIAHPSPMRGRTHKSTRSAVTTSTSMSTFRSNSASPPPDLLESGSISSDLESLELGNGGRRSGRKSRIVDGAAGKPLLPVPVTAPQTAPFRDPSSEAGPSRAYGKYEDEGEDANAFNRSAGRHDRLDARDDVNGKAEASSTSRTERKKRHRRRHRDKDGIRSRHDTRSGSQGGSEGITSGSKWMKQAGKNLSDRERALWIWVNVVDLDGYLQEVYEYYVGKGLYCIALRRILNLLTSGFVIVFSTFLFSCVDYSKLPSDGHGMLREVIVPHCSSRWSVPHIILTWILGVVFAWRLLVFALSTRKLIEMKAFYEHLLDVPNSDIQTIPWAEVVRRIGEIRNDNPTTSLKNPDGDGTAEAEGEHIKLDAHDVANRILRQENYLTALFNKDILDLHVRIPLPRQAAGLLPGPLVRHESEEDRFYLCFGRNSLTQSLEWNLRFCLLGFMFDERRHVRKDFVRGRNRDEAVAKLKNRFVFMGILNAIFAPFIILYLLMYSFFRYFEEYHKNPSSIGSRQYTPYARWRFREFNELPHLFERRLDESYESAKQYIDQFPKTVTALIMRFVAFVAGAFAAVLVLLSVVDPVFLHFEITQDRTVLFYLGLFTSVLAVARGMIPQDTRFFSPEELITEVVAHTHYMPDTWSDKLHSQAVHAEFSKLFEMKLSNFLQELVSVLLTPFILCFSLPRSSAAIIDFFREFTVHVDGIGYVCSFAVFDFKRQGKVQDQQIEAEDPKRSLFQKNRKMENSFLHFKITNPAWQPSDPSASLFLSKAAEGVNMSSPAPALNKNGPPRINPLKTASPFSEEQRLHERSNLYEKALQRSIMMHSTKLADQSKQLYRGIGRLPGSARSTYLAAMPEADDLLEEEEADGWETKMLKRKDGDLNGSREQAGLKQVGMLDMLQDVIRR